MGVWVLGLSSGGFRVEGDSGACGLGFIAGSRRRRAGKTVRMSISPSASGASPRRVEGDRPALQQGVQAVPIHYVHHLQECEDPL